MKAIIFVNGTVAEAAQTLASVRAGAPGAAFRAVVSTDRRSELLRETGLSPDQVVVYSPKLWLLVFLRLLWFLGLNRGPQVACLATDHSGGLKLLALALRGRVSLTLPGGEVVLLTLGHFLWLAFRTWGRRPGDICLVGTAPRAQLTQILNDLRRRHPGASIHGLLLASAGDLPVDSAAGLSMRALLAACRRQPRFATLVIPCTGNGQLGFKLLAWCLPLGYREIYNENNDFCSARDFPAIYRHVWWRLENRWSRLTALFRRITSRAFWFDIPQRVTVLGAASPARLAAIVEDARRRHAAPPCHGLLLPKLADAATRFDSATVLRPGSWSTYRSLLALAFGPRRSGYLVIPCTGEGHGWMKLLFSFMPLGRREIYNENNDFYSARNFGVVLRHFWWRFQTAVWALPNLRWRLRDWMTSRPNRVTVIGSASGLYLKTIVADLRRCHPGAPIHALLPGALASPVAYLFDSHTVLNLSSGRCWRDLLSLALGKRRSGYLVLPFTNEGYNAVKLLGFCLPFGLRKIYNENGDSYLVRKVGMMARHASWRLHHRIFYQAWCERRDRPWPLHLVHMLLYPGRLVAGAALLVVVRLRGRGCDYRLPGLADDRAEPDEVLASADRPVKC